MGKLIILLTQIINKKTLTINLKNKYIRIKIKLNKKKLIIIFMGIAKLILCGKIN
jgi:hypothetical protein